GLTTLGEVLRVVTPDESAEAAAEARSAATGARSAAIEARPAATGARPAAAAVSASQPAAVRKRVLVVEDSPTIVSVVTYFLELEGFEVFTATDGLLGLELALKERPDVIVSDVRMPGMDGIAMVKALRQDARMRGVRVLMLTSEDSVARETDGLEASADDYTR